MNQKEIQDAACKAAENAYLNAVGNHQERFKAYFNAYVLGSYVQRGDVGGVGVVRIGSAGDKKPVAEPVEEKKKPICKFGPNCDRKETCAFFHPKVAHATKKPLPEKRFPAKKEQF